jgi:hypothetical protein
MTPQPDPASSPFSARAAPAEPPPSPEPAASKASGSIESPALAVDSNRKQIALQLSYTTAGIGAFALLVIVSFAYLIGRQVTTGPAPAIASRSTEQIRQDEPQPQVLDFTRGGTSSIPPASNGPMRTQPQTSRQAPAVAPSPAVTSPAPSPGNSSIPEDDGPRTIGLNYIIIQSYRDQDMAGRYAQLLAREGVRCTVEQDLPNWSQGGPWYSIVGTRGFARIRNNPDYDSYMQSIRAVNERHGLTGFRRFDPQPYHWKGTR